MATTMDIDSFVVKVSFNNDMRRFSCANTIGFQKLEAQIADTFGLKGQALTLKYTDEDGDQITMSSDAELKDAIQLSKGVVRILAVPKAAAPQAPLYPELNGAQPVPQAPTAFLVQPVQHHPVPNRPLPAMPGHAFVPHPWGRGARGADSKEMRRMYKHAYKRGFQPQAGVQPVLPVGQPVVHPVHPVVHPIHPVHPTPAHPFGGPHHHRGGPAAFWAGVQGCPPPPARPDQPMDAEARQKWKELKMQWKAERKQWKEAHKEEFEQYKAQKRAEKKAEKKEEKGERKECKRECKRGKKDKCKSDSNSPSEYDDLAERIMALGFDVKKKKVAKMLAKHNGDTARVVTILSAVRPPRAATPVVPAPAPARTTFDLTAPTFTPTRG